MISLCYPFNREKIKELKAGDLVLISGTIYTARDAAHQKLLTNEAIPIKDSIIYYTGPTPTKPNEVVGSIGPTSSYRMDPFGEYMANKGMLASIGKGQRSEEFRKLCQEFQMVYFVCTGGIGALLSKCIFRCEIVAFPELGAEAIRKLEVRDFPVIVAYDSKGNSVF